MPVEKSLGSEEACNCVGRSRREAGNLLVEDLVTAETEARARGMDAGPLRNAPSILNREDNNYCQNTEIKGLKYKFVVSAQLTLAGVMNERNCN